MPRRHVHITHPRQLRDHRQVLALVQLDLLRRLLSLAPLTRPTVGHPDAGDGQLGVGVGGRRTRRAAYADRLDAARDIGRLVEVADGFRGVGIGSWLHCGGRELYESCQTRNYPPK